MLNAPQVVYILEDDGRMGTVCCVATIRAACTAAVAVRPRLLLADTIADVVLASSVISERGVDGDSA